MPTVIDRKDFSSLPFYNQQLSVQDKFDYDYPDGLDLSPESELHSTIVQNVMFHAHESHNKISERFDSWNQITKNMTAYIPADLKDNKGDNISKTPVIIPMSYATSETIITYLMTAFLNDPILAYSGTGPEDDPGAAVLERVIHHHNTKFKMGLALNTMWKDAIQYGIGPAACVWETVTGRRDGIIQPVYEGNKLVPISPFMYLPDPNIEASDIQEGQAWGWIERTSAINLLEEEQFDEDMFNAKYTKGLDGTSVFVPALEGDRKFQQMAAASSLRPMYVVNMYLNIIPKDWNLGDSEYPEKWFFRIAGDKILLKAEPMERRHNKFPGVCAAPDTDGYTPTPVSQLEIIYGLQTTMDFMFSSHVANVRKAVNDMLIVDPSLVNLNDLRNPTPGKLVRLRRRAWGKAGMVKEAVAQLQVNDITRGNIADSSFIIDILQRVSAASDNLQGIMRSSGERRSATESRTARQGALSRIEKVAKILSMQTMQPIAEIFAEHAIELSSQDVTVRMTGRFMEDLAKEYGVENLSGDDRVTISPHDLDVNYEIMAHDGAMPGGESPDL
jgi:hypothetical protein